MKKYKICVYAISKNEEKFASEWAKSMSEADEIIVLDTGSTDNTVNILKDSGVCVYEKVFNPWRFDTARNYSLGLIPNDVNICVCVDLDELFEPGWRDKLENAWGEDTVRARYRYTWNFNDDGSEGSVFWIDKIHSRYGFHWENPVHEVLVYNGEKNYSTVYVEGMQLNHHADPEKSRAQYLPLLELAVNEDPDNDRNVHYLGREYMYRAEWDKCIEMLKHHLDMPTSLWKDERCASMRYMAKAYAQKGDKQESVCWLYRSIAEAPYLREPYADLALMLYEMDEWQGVIYFSEKALRIKERPRTYICEAYAWGSLPYDLLSLGYYYTGQYNKAIEAVEKAIDLSPNDERLISNRSIMEKSASSKKAQ